MPYAVTHILLAIILVELFREWVVKDNKKFPRYYILIAAIGGVLPDFDYALFYLLYPFGFTYEQIHATFFHSIFIPLILLVIGLFIASTGIKNSTIRKKHMKLSTVFYILAATSFLHLILDSITWGGVVWFYPFSTFTLGINILNFFPEALRDHIFPTLDAILLLFWLVWMQFKLKIEDYF